MNYLVHVYSLLCALEGIAFERRERIFSSFSILLYKSLFVFFFSVLFLSLVTFLQQVVCLQGSYQEFKESKSNPWT